MNTPGTSHHPLEVSAEENYTTSLRLGIMSLVGGILCIGGTLSQEEDLAHLGLGGYALFGCLAVVYRAVADTHLKELHRIQATLG